MTSVSADSSLMLASFNVFDRRWTWLAYSRISCLGMRSRPRSSWIGGSSNKARRDQPMRQPLGQPYRVVHVGLSADHHASERDRVYLHVTLSGAFRRCKVSTTLESFREIYDD